MYSKLIAFTALILSVFAAKEDCTYDVWGSESDSQTTGYEFCTNDPLKRIASKDAAKITANLVGKTYTCNPLEPNLSEEQLKQNLGIDFRPYFKATFSEIEGKWWLIVGQYGDSECLFAQRMNKVAWGVGTCVKGIESEGYAHEMYFVNDDCAGLEAATEVDRDNVARGEFAKTTDGTTDLQALLIDPYPVLAAATNNSKYYVKNKVLSKAYTSTPDKTGGFCYGIGQKFQPPFHYAKLVEASGVLQYYNQIHFPKDGLICGHDCAADVAKAGADAVKGGNPAKAPVFFALSECGQLYKLNLSYNETNKDVAPFYGLAQGHYAFASLILHYSSPKQCNKCVTSLSTDPLVGLLAQAKAPVPKSRFVLCQTGVKAVSYIYQEEPDVPEDPNKCGEEEEEEDTTSAASSFSVMAALFAVVALLAVF